MFTDSERKRIAMEIALFAMSQRDNVNMYSAVYDKMMSLFALAKENTDGS
jgi:hypothetical protein